MARVLEIDVLLELPRRNVVALEATKLPNAATLGKFELCLGAETMVFNTWSMSLAVRLAWIVPSSCL